MGPISQRSDTRITPYYPLDKRAVALVMDTKQPLENIANALSLSRQERRLFIKELTIAFGAVHACLLKENQQEDIIKRSETCIYEALSHTCYPPSSTRDDYHQPYMGSPQQHFIRFSDDIHDAATRQYNTLCYYESGSITKQDIFDRMKAIGISSILVKHAPEPPPASNDPVK